MMGSIQILPCDTKTVRNYTIAKKISMQTDRIRVPIGVPGDYGPILYHF